MIEPVAREATAVSPFRCAQRVMAAGQRGGEQCCQQRQKQRGDGIKEQELAAGEATAVQHAQVFADVFDDK